MTLHQIVAESVHASCWCGAAEDQPCRDADGVHYARVARACRAGYITLNDFADAIHDDVFTGGDVLLDPEANAA